MQYKNGISWLISFVFLLVAFVLPGKNYYLVYDNNCMDRLEYSYEETRPGNEFIVYAVTLSSGEKILLEVGLESRAPIKTLDTQVLTNCEEARQVFNASLATKINNNIDQFYIVTPVNLNGQYRIATVNSAAYYHFDGASITANTQQYRFDYPLESRKNSDLSNGDDRGSVFYIETLPLGPCEVINLRQTYGRGNNYLDIYIVPELGVVEEQSSLSNTSYRLNKINNAPFADHLYRICNARSNNARSNDSPSGYNDSGLFAKSGTASQPEIKPEVTHRVKKGETLFAIAREYDVDIADLKVWNQLSTSVIYPGDQLIVSTPVQAQMQQQREGFATKGVDQPRSYGANDLFNTPQANGQPAWTQSTGRHVVQAGETTLSIAQMYGFTEERFRFFNELGPTERVREGDLLLTTDCLKAPNNTSTALRSDMQTKGVSSYSTMPENSNYTTPLNQKYEYTNQQNPAYSDEYLDFDRNYPDEFQTKSGETTPSDAPQSYGLPPGSTPRTPESSVPVGAPNDNFYSPSNYGPIPGRYNNNESLREPQSNNDPTNYENYLRSNQQTKGAVPSQGNTYGSVPNEYGNISGMTRQGLPDYEDQVTLTGVKRMHMVKEGETLASIAARYGTTVRRLRALNQMEGSEVVIPFQQIYVQK